MSIVKIEPFITDNLANFTFAGLTITANANVGNANLGNSATANFLSVNSNITSGNANLGNAVTGNYFIGNGYYLTGVTVSAGSSILNGNSNVSVNANSNVSISVGGTANIAVFATGGIYANAVHSNFYGDGGNITGTVPNANYSAYAGNVVGASQSNITSLGLLTGLSVSGYSSFIGNANVVGNINLNGTGNAVLGNLVTANYVTGTLTTSAQPNITSVGTLSSLTVTANITAGDVNAGNLLTANYHSGNGSLLTSLTGSNVTGQVGNALVSGTVYTAAQPNITSVGTLTSLTVGGNIVVSGNLTVTGNTTFVNSNIVDIQDSIIQLGTGANGAALTTTTSLDVGTALNYYNGSALTAFMGWKYANSEFTVASNVSISSSVVTINNLANIRANYFLGNGYYLAGVGTATTATQIVNGNSNIVVDLNSSIVMSANGVANVVTVSSNTVTISGNLISSNANLGNLAKANFFSGNGSAITYITGANVSGTVANATYALQAGNAGTVTTNAQPNITSVGVLTGLTVGNASSNTLFGNGTINAASNISTQQYFVGNGYYLTGITGGAANSAQTQYVATANTGTYYLLFGNTDANTFANVYGNANITFDSNIGNLITNYLTGTLTTASQPNISTIGNTGNVAVNGNGFFVNSNNIQLQSALYHIGTGSNGALLTTTDTKDRGSLFHYFNGADVTGFIGWKNSSGEVVFANSVTVASNVVSVTTYANIHAGNANLGNTATASYLSGILTSALQPNITQVGTLSSLAVTGNITSGNANLGNLVSANYISGNGYLLTGIGAPSLIYNGTSSANIVASNGNLAISINGTSNVAVVSSTGINVAGYITATGNISGNYIFGNGSQLTGITTSSSIVNGNANVVIDGSFNVDISANGVANVVSVSAIGANISGGLTVSNVTTLNGNVLVAGANVNLGNVANLHILGGSTGQYLKTDGTGNLSWATVSGGSGGGITYTANTAPPGTANVGDQWYNTTNNALYEYINDGTTSWWVDIDGPTVGSYTATTYVNHSYTGDGSTTGFTVTSGANTVNVLVFVAGLCYNPATDYTVSGTTLTFTTAPALNAVIQIRELPR